MGNPVRESWLLVPPTLYRSHHRKGHQHLPSPPKLSRDRYAYSLSPPGPTNPSLATELTSLLASSGGSPFPPLLLSSGPSTLLAETYVSSHPLSALLVHSRADPASAHLQYPDLFPTQLKEFTYEPHFAIAVMETEEGKLGGRLLEEFVEDGEVQGLVGGKDKEGMEGRRGVDG